MTNTIDDIYDQIGGFGWFQGLIIVWLYLAKAAVSWSMMLMSFAGYFNDFLCITDFEQSQSITEMYTDPTLNKAESDVSAINGSILNACSVNGTVCERYQFLGTKRTVISEWDLVCDLRWMKATIISVQMCGVLVGAILGGQSGDYFGRKKTFYGAFFVHAVLNVVAAFSVNWKMFMAMRFFIGMTIGATLVIVLPYCAEFYPLRSRHVIAALPMWQVGLAVFALTAYLLEDWANVHIACAALSVPFLLGFFYIPESPRWLATQGRVEESHKALQKMAALNQKTLPPAAIDVIKGIASEKKTERAKAKKDFTYLDLFKSKRSAKTTLIFSFQWAIMSAITYGLSFGVSSFAGNLYLNMFIISLVPLPSYFLVYLLVDRFGRRTTCLGFMILTTMMSAVCVVVYASVSSADRGPVISALSLVAKLFVGGAWPASMVWVAESYPTVTRSLGYGFASISSRIGGILAPFIFNLDETPLLAYILMAVTALLCTLATTLIPETNNKSMSETGEGEASAEDLDPQNAKVNKDVLAEERVPLGGSDAVDGRVEVEMPEVAYKD